MQTIITGLKHITFSCKKISKKGTSLLRKQLNYYISIFSILAKKIHKKKSDKLFTYHRLAKPNTPCTKLLKYICIILIDILKVIPCMVLLNTILI